jgi:hypothetical protein
MAATTSRGRATALAPIDPDVLYPLQDLAARSGLGKAALRTLRQNGLQVLYVGGRGFIFGRDFLEHVKQTGSRVKAGGPAK